MTIKDPTGVTWFVHHRLLMLLGQELITIVQKQKIMAWEMDIALRTMSRITKDLGLSNDKQDNALIENRNKNQGSGNGYYAENQESHYQSRLGAFK